MNNEFPADRATGIPGTGKRVLAAILALALAVTGCTTNPYTGEEEASNTGKGAGIILDIERRSSQYNPVYYRLQIYPGRSVWLVNPEGLKEGMWVEYEFSEQTGKVKRWVEI